jgi:hypothetical protein
MGAASSGALRFLPCRRVLGDQGRLGCLPVGYFVGIILFVGVLGYLDRAIPWPRA